MSLTLVIDNQVAKIELNITINNFHCQVAMWSVCDSHASCKNSLQLKHKLHNILYINLAILFVPMAKTTAHLLCSCYTSTNR